MSRETHKQRWRAILRFDPRERSVVRVYTCDTESCPNRRPLRCKNKICRLQSQTVAKLLQDHTARLCLLGPIVTDSEKPYSADPCQHAEPACRTTTYLMACNPNSAYLISTLLSIMKKPSYPTQFEAYLRYALYYRYTRKMEP